MNSVSDQIKQAASDRLKSPILGSFLLIWLVVNWQVPTALLTGTDCSSCRIEKVSAILHDKNNWDLLLTPLILTLGYLTVMQVLVHLYESIPLHLEARARIRRTTTFSTSDDVESYSATKTHCLEMIKVEMRNIDDIYNRMQQLRQQKPTLHLFDGHLSSMNSSIEKINAILTPFTPKQTQSINELVRKTTTAKTILKKYFIKDN